jgi:hypothetical protein
MKKPAESRLNGTQPESIASFRASLGRFADQYSEAQLVQLQIDIRAMARLLVDVYFAGKDVSQSRPRFDRCSTET